jgi:hypothetical protein
VKSMPVVVESSATTTGVPVVTSHVGSQVMSS